MFAPFISSICFFSVVILLTLKPLHSVAPPTIVWIYSQQLYYCMYVFFNYILSDSLTDLHSIGMYLAFMVYSVYQPRMPIGTPRRQDNDDCSDLLQSLCFDAAEHSSHGYRCSNRYEWYQTSSDVYINIMIPNVKEDDIIVRFTDTKVLYVDSTRLFYWMQNYILFIQVKVFIGTKPFPYNLSLHVSHNIIPDKSFMKLLKSKVRMHQYVMCIYMLVLSILSNYM